MQERGQPNKSGIACLLLLCLLLIQCAGDGKGERAVESTIIEKGSGRKAMHGEYLLVDIDILKLDSVLRRDEPGMLYQIRYDTYMNRLSPPDPLESGIYHLSKGDSAILQASDNITAYVRVVDIVDYTGYTKWRLEQTTSRQIRERQKTEETLRRESVAIDSVLNASHQKFDLTSSGIRYIALKKGAGEGPHERDTVFFDFDAVLLDGTELPNGVGRSGDKPRSFVMGSGQVFPCWQESIGILTKGGSGKFYLPSAMAFGSNEIVGIPPNSILVTEIRLVDIRRGKGKR